MPAEPTPTPTRVVNLAHVTLGGADLVYIGRPRGRPDLIPEPPASGCFGNPFSVQVYGGAQALERFKTYFLERVRDDARFRAHVRQLRGMRLACFCVDREGRGPCHGQIMAAWIDEDYRAELAAARAARGVDAEAKEIEF